VTDSYLINVWTSGGYMHLAEILVNDSPQQSKIALQKAKNIIDSDDRLIIRRRQLATLISSLSTPASGSGLSP
jgi:hypothetical protein